VLLDHGLYDYLNVKDRVNLCQLYKAIIMHNDVQMKHYSSQLGVTGNLYKSANQSVS
jgi:aarF domain-containing kinase